LVESDPITAIDRLLSPALYPRQVVDLPVEVIPVTSNEIEVLGIAVRLRP